MERGKIQTTREAKILLKQDERVDEAEGLWESVSGIQWAFSGLWYFQNTSVNLDSAQHAPPSKGASWRALTPHLLRLCSHRFRGSRSVLKCLTLCDPVDYLYLARQAPLSMGFSRQEYWSGLPFPSPGDLPDPGGKPGSPALQADLPSEPSGIHHVR